MVVKTICVEKKNQLDATEWFIALIIRSTCFGHFCAHHQELETTGCNRRNGPDFGRVFLMLNYTEKPQNTHIQS